MNNNEVYIKFHVLSAKILQGLLKNEIVFSCFYLFKEII